MTQVRAPAAVPRLPGDPDVPLATRAFALARRLPLTTGTALLVLVLGVGTRALWDPLASRPEGVAFAYGLPAFEDGRWWTVLTGALVAMHPLQYVPVVLGLVVLGGFSEWRLGARRTAVVLVGAHVVGVCGAAAFLALTRDQGWGWATALAQQTDAGPSAGFLGAAAAASATLVAPWRGRFRVVLVVYGVLSLAHVGGLADLEHAVAISAGLVLGPVLLGRRPRLSIRPLTRRDYRLLAAGFFVVAGIEGIYLAISPLGGPLASTLTPEMRAEALRSSDGLVSAGIQAAVWFALAGSLYKGRRWAWRWAVALVGLVTLVQAVGTVGLLVAGAGGWPAALYDVAGNALGLSVLVAGRRAFRNPSRRRGRRTPGSLTAPADEAGREAAAAALHAVGSVNRLAWMTTWPENRWYVSGSVPGYVTYRVHAGVALGLCDPVAARPQDRALLLARFADDTHRSGLVPCLFSVTSETARHAHELGWHALQVAEEAVIDLPDLDFRGKAWQDVRTALNQATKLGISWRMGPLAELPRGLQMQVRAISAAWVEDKGLPEMGFTLGGVDEAMDPEMLVGVAVDGESTVHGVTSWMPVLAAQGRPAGWTLDVMRRLPGGFRYSMEFLIASACLAFRSDGFEVVSLSGAPLARAGRTPSDLDRGSLDTFLDQLGSSLEPHYGFRSLHAFKAKFQPRLEPLHLVFPDDAALPRIGVALSRAYLPEAGLRDLVTLARAGR
jgi:lysylphosphatidylglycerol synthetase-like protein (DUF2156 family)